MNAAQGRSEVSGRDPELNAMLADAARTQELAAQVQRSQAAAATQWMSRSFSI